MPLLLCSLFLLCPLHCRSMASPNLATSVLLFPFKPLYHELYHNSLKVSHTELFSTFWKSMYFTYKTFASADANLTPTDEREHATFFYLDVGNLTQNDCCRHTHTQRTEAKHLGRQIQNRKYTISRLSVFPNTGQGKPADLNCSWLELRLAHSSPCSQVYCSLFLLNSLFWLLRILIFSRKHPDSKLGVCSNLFLGS